jgi:uncharacterized peroxidase-related enzyme
VSRISIPPTIEAAPAASHPLLRAVKAQLGAVPNLFRLVAKSPTALQAYLGLNVALANGLDAATRERIALVVAELNGCSYCLSSHTYLGKNVAKLDDAEIEANREGSSNDPKAAAAVHFAARIVETRGHVTDEDLEAVKAAGYSEAEIIEIVLFVALNTLGNYINEVAKLNLILIPLSDQCQPIFRRITLY